MAFEKQVMYEIASYETYEPTNEDELRKVASANVDLPKGFVYDPDYLYLWIRIVSSGESYGPNKNGDYFPDEELVGNYQTFNEANVFKNHENKQIEKAIGKIFAIRWDPIMRCVEIFKGIDKKLAPEIARGFLKGYMTDVSMGCKVPYTICSVCGNKARKASEFCDHIRHHRMEFLGNGERVFEINYEPKFHDSSVVLNGAERVAKALFVMDEPMGIDGQTIVKSFRKAAGKIALCDNEIEKVANHVQTLHPLLQPNQTEKLASDNEFMRKVAELEKELTGKIMNIASNPNECQPESAEPLMQIIKFLTEKRMDDSTLSVIGSNLSAIASRESLPLSKVFTAFLSIAELMGIELFPTELHTLLTNITNAKVDNDMVLSKSEDAEVLPSGFAKGVRVMSEKLEAIPEFDSPDEMFSAYDEAPFHTTTIGNDIASFFGNIQGSVSNSLDEDMPIRIIRIIKDTLSPFQPFRSNKPEFLLPRMAVVLSGHKPLIGDATVAKDINIMTNPTSIGDVLAGAVYGNYAKMRPSLTKSTLVKVAQQHENQLEKIAEEKGPYKGIKRKTLLMTAVPAVYGASLFQKSRKENGKNLSDAENFLATRPDVISAGIVLGGKPLTRAIANKAGAVKDGVVGGANKVVDITKEGFRKLTSENYLGLVKVADSLESGNFNAFNDEMLNKFAFTHNLHPEYAAALKIATLCDIGGEEKIASEISKKYDFANYEKAEFLKFATEEAKQEMAKAAGEFTNMMLIDTALDAKKAMTTTLPGRVLDSLVFSSLSKKFAPNDLPSGGVQ